MNTRRIFMGPTVLWLLLAPAASLALAKAPPGPVAGSRPAAAGPVAIAAINDTFTYQGSLTENGLPANGLYDFSVSIWDSVAGGTKKTDCDLARTQNIPVNGGLFTIVCAPTTFVDIFNGYDRYLEVKVKKDGAGSYTTLSRQSITPTPYALGLRPGAVVKDATSSVSFNNYLSVMGEDVKKGLQSSVTDSTNDVFGVYATARNTRSTGVVYGVYATARGESGGDSFSIYGYGDDLYTISGFFENTEGLSLRSESYTDRAIEAERYEVGASAVWSRNHGNGAALFGTSVNGNGIQGETDRADKNYGVYTTDNFASNNIHLRGAVMRVVQNGGAEPLEAGDVAVFCGMGQSLSTDGLPEIQVRRAASANSTAVAGVVYSRYNLKALPRGDTDEAPADLEIAPAGAVPPGEHLLLVVEGPALVKVSAVKGLVQPGDLLATSGQAGYANKAAVVTLSGVAMAVPGTILGKALDVLAEGVKMIYVYVTLQ